MKTAVTLSSHILYYRYHQIKWRMDLDANYTQWICKRKILLTQGLLIVFHLGLAYKEFKDLIYFSEVYDFGSQKCIIICCCCCFF